MRGIVLAELSPRRQFNLVHHLLCNLYGEQTVTDALAEPPPPWDHREEPKKTKKPAGRPMRLSREQAERMAKDLAAYDKSVSR